jgi:nickel/cobalt exporter
MRRVKRLVVVLVAALALLVPATASAHPLGNFTINHYAGIELAGSRVYLHFALDVAEIPTYQLGGQIRSPGYPRRLARDLELELDGRRAPLRVLEHRTSSRPGAGGLPVLRLDVVYAAQGRGRDLRFEDDSFAGHIGWREVTIAGRDGGRVVRSSAPSKSVSDELRAYPKSLLRSPLAVSRAAATLDPGGSPGAAPSLRAAQATPRVAGGFAALIGRADFSVGVLLVSRLLAAFWGAAHALTPGHGKALVAAYLVGTRGKPRHAFLLGGTVTLAHTAGVFGLGIVTLGLSQLIVPEQLYPWLTLVSGVLVVIVGASVLRQRLRNRAGHVHQHAHDHEHPHGHHHHSDGAADMTSKGILGVGVAAGLLPCPSALVVLLSAIALHRIGIGLALIFAFSVGLATTITGIGLVAVFARRAFSRVSLEGPLVRTLPAVSAALILVVGVVITARAVPGVL